MLSCCLIHISIIILRNFIFTMFTIFTTFTPRLDLSLFMSVLWDLLLISIFIFIMVHRIISWETRSFAYFLEYVLLFLDNNVDKKCEKILINKCWFFVDFNLVLLLEVLLIKKYVFDFISLMDNLIVLNLKYLHCNERRVCKWLKTYICSSFP